LTPWTATADGIQVLGYTLSGHNMEIDCGNKVLGKGGYATVFEGVWGVNRRPVAVKRVFLHAEGTRQEEEALRKLDHPNVVKLFHAESGIVLR
jgi:serine/threonine-protein kinase/endoribonuclease IRE1